MKKFPETEITKEDSGFKLKIERTGPEENGDTRNENNIERFPTNK